MLDGAERVVQYLVHHIQAVCLKLVSLQLLLLLYVLILQLLGLLHPSACLLEQTDEGRQERTVLGQQGFGFFLETGEPLQLLLRHLGQGGLF